ncbi:cytochrome c-type biogenesis protein [Psychromonas sp. MME2]|uniref:cytochrome c-type biogenesis protein n=1 Tax=unclassified Psychromonas TaxID=2614957 RepID=UPI00339BB017
MNQLLFSPVRQLLMLLCCITAVSSANAIDSFEFDNPQQEQLFLDLSKQLRCPKCQNQNISDSNAELAKDLRNKTYELVKQGKSEEQVIDYMVARFGNFVRYDPPMTPATIFLWLGPLIFIVLGFYILYRQINSQNKTDDPLNNNDAKRLQTLLGKNKQSEKNVKQGNQ